MINSLDLYIVVQNGRLLCLNGQQTLHTLPTLLDLGVIAAADQIDSHSLGQYNLQNLHLLPLLAEMGFEAVGAEGQWHWADLREFLALHTDDEFQYHARAVQYFHWLREHQFCGICGSATAMATTENALECKTCNKFWFPRIQPCIITLIHNKDKVLLAKHRRYTTNTYSCIAGFAESGENLEQTLMREVAEEVGVRVHNLRYFGSQAWPFPYQLMVGFFAEYLDGDIQVDQDEIVAAEWWSIHDLPDHPPSVSISGQLIEHYAANPKL
ncbi:NAD(+) diphosphatase [Halioxenophilus sp. WMMB6]|uniref:NAD(+) diphosphatase n=1 Tax=Halioxenophilus sp. WMMB6 TaxID=3073815 RepID=UPI00295F0C59|nr:NAD(+) diphosphatase [Halioxenophilus sp. WMMB6]